MNSFGEREVLWSARAVEDLIELRRFIARENPAAAIRIGSMILAAAQRLSELPAMGRSGRLPGTRELVVPGTSYLIPYRVQQGKIELIAVLHGRQLWPEE